MSAELKYQDLLIEMLSIPALSRKEGERSAFLKDYIERLGHSVQSIGHNLLVGNPGAPGASFMLNSHMDTVPPVEAWKGDPFKPVLDGDVLTALGSNDAGASVVSLLAAYHRMQKQLEGKINLLLVISTEEEVSGSGGIVSVLPHLEDVKGAIVGEPTLMQPAVAERGLMVLDAEVHGEAGHAARNEGVNAIYRAMKDLEAIREMKFSKASRWLPGPGAQVTMIEAGTGHNVVPDICRYVVDVRSNDCYSNKELLAMIRECCHADLEPRSTRLRSSGIEEDHFLMKTVVACGLEAFGSSTLSDMALIPFPAIKMGPGNSARSHTAGEFIRLSEIEAGIEGYCHFLEKLNIG